MRRCEQADGASLKELVYRARFLVARALEAQGLVDDAVIALETMLSPRVGTVMHIKVGHRAEPLLPRVG